mgnify:CR=1 FL=1
MVLKAKIIYFVIILLSQTVVRTLSQQPFFILFVILFCPFTYFHATEKPVEPKFYGYLTFGHNVILR